MSLGYRKGAKSGVEPEAKTGIRASIYSDGMNQLSTVELGTKGEPWQHVNIGFRSIQKSRFLKQGIPLALLLVITVAQPSIQLLDG